MCLALFAKVNEPSDYYLPSTAQVEQYLVASAVPNRGECTPQCGTSIDNSGCPSSYRSTKRALAQTHVLVPDYTCAKREASLFRNITSWLSHWLVPLIQFMVHQRFNRRDRIRPTIEHSFH